MDESCFIEFRVRPAQHTVVYRYFTSIQYLQASGSIPFRPCRNATHLYRYFYDPVQDMDNTSKT